METIESIFDIQLDEHAGLLGYSCLGFLGMVYPELPNRLRTDWFRLWIWENAEGVRIALWDQGHTWCNYFCGGSEEDVLAYYEKMTS